MSKSDFQEAVATFVAKQLKPTELNAWLLDLESEVGELAKEWLKASDYGRGEFSVQPGWIEEMGDVYFVLLALAAITGVDLEQAVQKAMEKYKLRIATSGTAASGP